MYENKSYNRGKRRLALAICLALLLSLLPVFPLVQKAEAAGEKTTFGEYATLAKVYEQDGCFSMQGMAVHENYVYACKTNNGEDTKAVVARINIHDGSKTFLTNAATGTYVFGDFVHGNEIEVERIGGALTMFIPTMASGSESLVRYKISGTTATRVGNYTMKCNGSNISGGAIRVMHYSENYITFIFKSGNTFYTGTIPVDQYSGTVEMSVLFHFNYSQMYYNGVLRDISGFSLQGFEYYDGKIYLPLSGHTVSGMVNVAIILVYDIQGIKPGCTLDPERNLNFYVASQEYPAYFEIESCGISPRTGKMYFNTNSRVTNTNTNHDGVHYFTDWEYEPSQRNTDVNNYRWEVIGDKLTSVSTNGSALNHAIMLQGSVSNKKFTLCRYATDRTIVLEHDRLWEVEWKSTGVSSGSMIFATEGDCAHVDAPYIYRRGGMSLIALGYYDGQYNQDVGVDLSLHGIDESQTHVYRLSNRLQDDGSNMVYLSVDGVELGAMDHYYVNGYDQGTTSDWVSGKDFRFSYFGPYNYRLDNIQLEYIQVWGNGEAYEPSGIYRWETKNNTLTAVMGNSIPTLTSGSISGGTYTTAQHSLSQGVTLMHDQPWTIQWRGAGSTAGGTLLGSDNRGDCTNARYLMRNGNVLFFGYRDGSNHHQYGVDPTDHGVDMSVEHLFTLQNKVNADGSNMVYLSVDGRELGPMNQYYKNGGSQSTTSDWISGKDFSFNWMGTLPYSLNKQTLDYMQIWENGILEGDVEDTYRWETRNDSLVNITTEGFTPNTAELCSGSISGGDHNSTSYQLDRTVVLRHDRSWMIQWQCQGEASGSGMLLSSTAAGDEPNSLYLFRNSNLIGFGSYTGSRHEQWGVGVAKHSIDHTVLHTYALKNKRNADGTNTVWFYLDGEEVAPMTEHFVYGSVTDDSASNWISGKDLTFSYIGNEKYPLKGTTLNYLLIDEGCAHTYGPWSVTAPTCTQGGSQTRICTECGSKEIQNLPATGHSYAFVSTTAPTCTEEGYTTYACTVCGDSYRGNETAPNGHSYKSMVIAPTCTEAGYTAYTCTLCGDSYKGNETAPTGHRYQSMVIDPTCTNGGYTTYRCSTCGDTYQSNATPATGHDYKAVVTAPTCTAQGYTNYTCVTCGVSYQDGYISATGHSYSTVVVKPTCDNGGYTTYTCADCGHSYKDHITSPKGHSYANGICGNCGAADPNYEETVVRPTLTLKSPALEFKDMICIIAFYTAENTQDVVEMGMITYNEKVGAADITTADHVIPGATYDDASGRYFSSSQGIHAKYLGDTVYLACYAKLTDGTYVYTKLAPYSAITYANSQLKNSTDMKLKQLVVSMLNYGAAAQAYFGHNTDHLANAALTADQLALPESYRGDMVAAVPAAPSAKQGSFVNNSGFSSRKPAISFEGAFCINYFFTPKYAPSSGITLYYWTEADYNAADVLTASNATGKFKLEGSGTGQYSGDITGIAAKNLSQAVYVAAAYKDSSGTAWTSGVLGYSIGAYCSSQASKGGTIAALAQATAVYGYHAKQYFG